MHSPPLWHRITVPATKTVSALLRVALAYLFSGFIGVTGIWISIPIGWVLADIVGILYMSVEQKRLDIS